MELRSLSRVPEEATPYRTGKVADWERLCDNTREVVGLFREETPLLVFGIRSPTMLSFSGEIWAVLIGTPKFSIGELRMMRSQVLKWVNSLEGDIWTWVHPKDVRSKKFIEFFSLILVQEQEDFILYKRGSN